MGLQQDIAPYREKLSQFVTGTLNPPDHSCDNGLLFSSEYVNLLLNGAGSNGQMIDEVEWLEGMCLKCEIEPGLMHRYPGDAGDEQHDDLTGVAAISPTIAARILAYGRKHDFCWNPERPGHYEVNFDFGRMTGFVEHLTVAAGESLTWLEALGLAGSFLFSAFTKFGDTDGPKLAYLTASSVAGKHLLVDLSIRFWSWRMKRIYPGGMAQVYGSYFGTSHPFARYARQDFLIGRFGGKIDPNG